MRVGSFTGGGPETPPLPHEAITTDATRAAAMRAAVPQPAKAERVMRRILLASRPEAPSPNRLRARAVYIAVHHRLRYDAFESPFARPPVGQKPRRRLAGARHSPRASEVQPVPSAARRTRI